MRGVKAKERDVMDAVVGSNHDTCGLPPERQGGARTFTPDEHELYNTMIALGWVRIVWCRSGAEHTHYEVTPAGLEAMRLQDLVDKVPT